MNTAIASVLAKHKVKADRFKPHPHDPGVLGADVSGRLAWDIWREISGKFRSTGIWPVLRESGWEADAVETESDRARPPKGDVDKLLKNRLADLRSLYSGEIGARAKRLSAAQLAEWADSTGVYQSDEGPEQEDRDWPTKPPPGEPAFFTLRRDDSARAVKTAHLALVPVDHAWESIQRLGFGGFNECPRPSLLAALFREWQHRYGAVPVVITSDIIECFVARPPKTKAAASRLALEHWLTCEDLVMQGTMSVAGLARQLWRRPTWYFWWD